MERFPTEHSQTGQAKKADSHADGQGLKGRRGEGKDSQRRPNCPKENGRGSNQGRLSWTAPPRAGRSWPLMIREQHSGGRHSVPSRVSASMLCRSAQRGQERPSFGGRLDAEALPISAPADIGMQSARVLVKMQIGAALAIEDPRAALNQS